VKILLGEFSDKVRGKKGVVILIICVERVHRTLIMRMDLNFGLVHPVALLYVTHLKMAV
jgi:hypothetical protein